MRHAAVLLLFLFGGVAGCKSGGIPDDAKTTVMSFVELDCTSCGEDMARVLIKKEGVYKTGFDRRRAELTVVADPEVDAFALAQKNRPSDEEWRLVPGKGKGRYLPWKEVPQGLDVELVATDGRDVPELAPHLAKGKITIVDFSAPWCEPCRTLDEHVLGVVAKRSDVAYRKLDVGDWDTPLGKRYLGKVDKLPYVMVFDAAGKRIDAFSGLDLERLERAIAPATPQ
jgi:thiol-disulfide isomerase/thioredoxin